MNVIQQDQGVNWAAYNGDSCQLIKRLPDCSVGYSIFSPPFASLYTYSDLPEDLGNSKNDAEFYQHFSFLVGELYRILKPGRNLSFHCMEIPAMKERDGYIGLKDFPGDMIRMFESHGFIYHSRVAIWKDPLTEVTRTKAIGLQHKQLVKDSVMCRSGLPDYLITMRKPGENVEPVSHPDGLTEYAGTDEIQDPKIPRPDPDREAAAKKIAYVGQPVFSHQAWRKYASPVWMDINQTNTLNRAMARDNEDERHICPLQLDVIERGITLYSNPNDIVFSPFMGIGSEIYQAIKMGRRGIGIELKESYYQLAVKNIKRAVEEREQGG